MAFSVKTWIAILGLGWVASAAMDPELTALVERLQKKYDGIQTLTARFEQTYESVRFEKGKKAHGKLEIQKPGKMRWDYREPRGKVMVSDGETLTLFDPQDRQAIVSKKPKDGSLPASVAFLAGEGKLAKSFALSWIQKPKDGRAVLRAIPKDREANVKEIHFTVDLARDLIVATLIVDELQGASEIRFEDIELNRSIPSKRFSFTPPKGTTILNPQQGETHDR